VIDSHCHVFMPEYADDRDAVLTRARLAGVSAMVVVGYDLATSRDAVALAEAHPDLFATVAIHPHHASSVTPAALEELRRLAAHPRVVAIGETGLDYYRNRAPQDTQIAAFRAQLDLARRAALPVVIHDREAHADTMRILNEDGRGLPAIVLHCFSGDRRMAEQAWAHGYYVGIDGPITYPNARELRALVQDAPRDRILLETDAPYLPPTPHRGTRNEPARLPLIAEGVAALWGCEPAAVDRATTANTICALRLPLPGGTP
jgi:TatD DNase family protein